MTLFSRRQMIAASAAAGALAPLMAGPAQAATHTVTISGFRFSPADLTIAVGDSVTFVNEDNAPHTASFDGGPDTGTLSRGDSATLTFDRAGSLSYICRFHPNMRGMIRVQ